MIICISRELASGGHKMAKQLAEKLGLEFYDQKLVDEAIKKMEGADEERLRKTDEKRPNAFLYGANYDALDPSKQGLSDHDVMFMLQSEVILQAAEKGNCLFVGRCADYILKEAGIPRYSIFITAPFEDRVKRNMETVNTDEKSAVAMIRKTDKTRKNYYNYHTGGNWGVPSNYDFCINTSSLGIEGSMEAIIKLCTDSEKSQI